LKKLIIIRHSKSDWNHNTSDLLRPISHRGIKDAKIMSNVLNKLELQVDHIFISTAKRTIETANIFFDIPNPQIPHSYEEKIYDFSGYNVLNFIKKINNKINSAVLFTHNNSCNFLVNYFYNHSIHVSTSSILVFDFNVNLWKDIKEANHFRYYFPKDYR
tara:strand:- start:4577 stop:5056 length:480 start_codon:yes stop_codon:yes gene_type:complete